MNSRMMSMNIELISMKDNMWTDECGRWDDEYRKEDSWMDNELIVYKMICEV